LLVSGLVQRTTVVPAAAGPSGGSHDATTLFRVARKANPARLVIALLVAAVLAVFLLYTSIAGGGNPSIAPSELAGRTGEVQLVGLVVGPAVGDAHAEGMRFKLRDIGGPSKARVPVVYTGSVPDLFKPGRHIVLEGRLRRGTFVAEPGSMITKCPSKYVPKKSGDTS
jgi:cytochrome c-type biogenesis protein CcmE